MAQALQSVVGGPILHFPGSSLSGCWKEGAKTCEDPFRFKAYSKPLQSGQNFRCSSARAGSTEFSPSQVTEVTSTARRNKAARKTQSARKSAPESATVLAEEDKQDEGTIILTLKDSPAIVSNPSLNGSGGLGTEDAAAEYTTFSSKSGTNEETTGIEVDLVVEADLKENGFRSTRRTKLICTVGPACCSFEQLEALAIGGMNVARLNMCHGTHDWHRNVINIIRQLNKEKGFSIAIMMDTEGSEIHMGDLGGATSAKAEDGEEWIFTVRKFSGPPPEKTITVNYDGFVDDVIPQDEVVVDGGMVRFEVLRKIGPDVVCRVIDAGLLLPRANLTFFRKGRLVRERNAMLPTISSKDWIDIDFAIAEDVDCIAVSFVKGPDVIKHLHSYVAARAPNKPIALFCKIESIDSLKNLAEIIEVSDGAMVARGDLGAQIPLEQVPSVQQEIVHICRQLNKPVIVASQLLESMIEFPTPTRAEVADISEAVRQRADALMLSGESAMGQYPEKALSVLRTVSTRIEAWCRDEKHHESMKLQEVSSQQEERVSEQICNSVAQMANKLNVEAIFVYTRRGYMASLLSRNRPDCPIFAFTNSQTVRQRLNMYWGLIPFRLDFSDELENNLQRTFALLKARGMMKTGDLIIAISDLASGSKADMLQAIQIRKVP